MFGDLGWKYSNLHQDMPCILIIFGSYVHLSLVICAHDMPNLFITGPPRLFVLTCLVRNSIFKVFSCRNPYISHSHTKKNTWHEPEPESDFLNCFLKMFLAVGCNFKTFLSSMLSVKSRINTRRGRIFWLRISHETGLKHIKWVHNHSSVV